MALEDTLFALIAAFFIVFLVFAIAIYLYTSFAYMSIGRKAKLSSPGLAWVPIVGPNIIAFQSARMHWWPWLLLLGYFIPVLNFICMLVFAAFSLIWHWKMFEKIGMPNWWSILIFIPLVNLVIIGIAAWSRAKRN